MAAPPGASTQRYAHPIVHGPPAILRAGRLVGPVPCRLWMRYACGPGGAVVVVDAPDFVVVDVPPAPVVVDVPVSDAIELLVPVAPAVVVAVVPPDPVLSGGNVRSV